MRVKVSKYVADKLSGLSKKDLRIQTFKGSGPGGQHRNKRETAVRITHKSTGISASASDNKSQERNRRSAFKKLAKKLVAHYREEDTRCRLSAVKDEMGRIRTYNAMRNVVKDHRTGVEANYASVLDGNIDSLIEAMIGKTGGI